MDYLLVGFGGIFGSVARYVVGKKIADSIKTKFPLGTFIINITGALLLGIVMALNLEKNLKLILGDGFLGAFTTFSTFMYEDFKLIEGREWVNAGLYVFLSIIVGIIGFSVGLKVVTALIS